MLEAKKRDWLARCGTWAFKDSEVETPNILFYQSDSVHALDGAEVLLLKTEIPTEKPFVLDGGSLFVPAEFENDSIPPDIPYSMSLDEIGESMDNGEITVLYGDREAILERAGELSERVFVLGNALEMLRFPLDFVRRVLAVRTQMSPHGVLYAPGIATPANLSVLMYCGIDLVDSLRVIMESSYGRFHTELGSMHLDEASGKLCHCPACGEGISETNLIEHNLHLLLRELHVCRNAVERGKLRELAERRMLSSPWTVSVVRHLDRRFYAEVEPHVPLAGSGILALSDAALTRPDVVRFRKRLSERYSKPASGRILILLPCSARKPYSLSKSHRAFRRAIWSSTNRFAVHEVIVTSPLGLVPRELEMFYPAQNYDIPVTGDWSTDEQRILRETLHGHLERNKYDMIIAHLSVEKEFISEELEGAVLTCDDSATSLTSLKALEQAVSDATKGLPKVPAKHRLVEDLTAMAVFQFGEAGSKLTHGCHVEGRYPGVRILHENHLATLVPSRGMLSLTLAGGMVLAQDGAYTVEIEDFRPEGNIFAVGVKDADPCIRQGDDVVVVREGEVRAVGVARMPAKEMRESRRGEAVHVRHRA